MNNQDNIDDLFRLAREQKPEASFNETKDLFLTSLESKAKSNDVQKRKIFTFKNGIIMSTLIGILIAISIFFAKDTNEKQKVKQQATEEQSKTQDLITEKQLAITSSLKKNKIVIQSSKDLIPEIYDLSNNQSQFPVIEEQISKKNNISFSSNSNEEYIFPKLTEEEIKKTLKQKKRMLKALEKIDKDYYSYIPSGSFEYQGEMISVQGFMMQKTEVSNLEYRTFLFDLLIQNRKGEFLKAKPDQKAWKIALGDSAQYMIDNYFSNEMYNNYPVNNISREGAELYCIWLTRELANYIGEKNLYKLRLNDIRLPTRQEWVKAASVEGKFKKYPVKSDSIYDITYNCFTANFNLKSNPNFFKKGGYKTEMDKEKSKYYTTVKYFMRGVNCYIAPTGFNFGEKRSYGLFQMSGNVAEMVVDVAKMLGQKPLTHISIDSLDLEKLIPGKTFIGINDEGKVVIDSVRHIPKHLFPGTAGGGWMNSAEEIKILAPDNHSKETNPHPNIGFRVVTTYLGKGSYNYIQSKNNK
jgi:formylglycine-generating enzyme required for sulfatase activity